MLRIDGVSNEGSYVYSAGKSALSEAEDIALFAFANDKAPDKKPVPAPKPTPKPAPTPKDQLTPKEITYVAQKTGLRESYIKEIVGYERVITGTYADTKGTRSMGIGHNIITKADKKLGKRWDNMTDKDKVKKEVIELFITDMKIYKQKVKKATGGAELTQGQQEALVDLMFNMGSGQVGGSQLMAYVRAGENKKAVGEFNFIAVTVDGEQKVLPLLCERRIDNIKRFSGSKPDEKATHMMQFIMYKGLAIYDEKIDYLKAHPPKVKVDPKKPKPQKLIEYEDKLYNLRQARKRLYNKGMGIEYAEGNPSQGETAPVKFGLLTMNEQT